MFKNIKLTSSAKFSITFAVITLLSFFLRVFNVSYPKKFIMDEVYYVPDAASILKSGYEIGWDRGDSTEGILSSFLNGSWDATVAGYGATHPPFGKMLIALGMLFYGPYETLGWRISAVIAGTLIVALVMALAYLIFNSSKVSVIAGLIVAIDPMMIAMSRVAHLDIFVTLFALAGVVFSTVYIKRRIANSKYSSFLNGWLVLAYISFGLAASAKWSGMYFLAAFVVIIFIINIRHSSIDAKFKRIITSVLAAVWGVLISAITYLSTWVFWLLTIGNKGNLFDSLVNLFSQHIKLFKDNASLVEKHGYGSNAFEWATQSHPTLLFYEKVSSSSVASVSSMPNLLIWYGAIVSLIVFIVLIFKRKVNVTLGLILVASVAAGWVPWMLFYGRTIFQFYSVIFAPYIFIIFAYVLYITFKKVTSYKKSKINFYRLAFLSYILIALVFAFKLYGGSVGLEQIDGQSSYAMFTQWQHFAEDYSLYDSSQQPENVKENPV